MMNWEIKSLGELCQIELGKTPSRGNKTFWDTEKTTTNVWLSIADLLNSKDNIVSDSKEYISDKGAEICKVVKSGTLLVSFKLTLGRLAFAGRDLFTNEAIAALTIKNEKELSKEFLYHCLNYFDWNSATDGDIKIKGRTLNKEKLKEIPIPLPPLPEQQRWMRYLRPSPRPRRTRLRICGMRGSCLSRCCRGCLKIQARVGKPARLINMSNLLIIVGIHRRRLKVECG